MDVPRTPRQRGQPGRHVLIQAAWSYHHPPKVSVALKARQRGQLATGLSHAWKAQHRLHRLYQHLAYRKQPQIAAVAVARELVGFLWAVMRQYEPAVARA
jgi:transposase